MKKKKIKDLIIKIEKPKQIIKKYVKRNAKDIKVAEILIKFSFIKEYKKSLSPIPINETGRLTDIWFTKLYEKNLSNCKLFPKIEYTA